MLLGPPSGLAEEADTQPWLVAPSLGGHTIASRHVHVDRLDTFCVAQADSFPPRDAGDLTAATASARRQEPMRMDLCSTQAGYPPVVLP